jgi:hypothetical protein
MAMRRLLREISGLSGDRMKPLRGEKTAFQWSQTRETKSAAIAPSSSRIRESLNIIRLKVVKIVCNRVSASSTSAKPVNPLWRKVAWG